MSKIDQDLENDICMGLCILVDKLGMDSESFEDDIAQIAIMIKMSEAITKKLKEISDNY